MKLLKGLVRSPLFVFKDPAQACFNLLQSRIFDKLRKKDIQQAFLSLTLKDTFALYDDYFLFAEHFTSPFLFTIHIHAHNLIIVLCVKG